MAASAALKTSATANLRISRQEAAKELLRRRAARTGLIGFTEYTLPSYQSAWHHILIANKLDAVARGEIDRLMINMPPRHGKSELASRRFPAMLLGIKPELSIISASYNMDKASEFGGEVRDIVRAAEYRALFPHIELKEDTTAKGFWRTEQGGYYIAAGVGTAITGRGTVGPVVLIDDPLKDRAEADSQVRRETVKSWYSSSILSRLPRAIIVIQCMVGSTPVLMADGTEKPLSDVRPGDVVATYEDGRLSTSTVLQWKNQGSDQVYKIRMSSGTTVEANERHPFLVSKDGKLEWVRLSNLRPGLSILRATGESGEPLSASKTAALSQQSAKVSATRTTTNGAGRAAIARRLLILARAAKRTFATAMGLAWSNTKRCFALRAGDVRSVTSVQARTFALIGAGSYASTTATTLEKYAGCSATTAISSSATVKKNACCSGPLSTFEIVPDVIVAIEPAGREDVFDIQVDRTENFIANGLVSHNTRWHEDDLSGWLLEQEAKGGDKWDVLTLPAINANGEALWPEFYPIHALERIKASSIPRDWHALFQQSPTPDEGDFFHRDWFQRYKPDEKPQRLSIFGTSDYAVSEGKGDFTVHRVWGIDERGHIWLIAGWRGQTTSDVWIERLLDLVHAHRPFAWFGESGVIQKSVEPYLIRRSQERRVYCRWEWLPSITDKSARARGFQARAAMKMVHVPEGAEGDGFIEELIRFPAGKHDDEVDTASLMGRALDEAHPATKAAPVEKQARPDYGFGRKQNTGDWMTS